MSKVNILEMAIRVRLGLVPFATLVRHVKLYLIKAKIDESKAEAIAARAVEAVRW